MSKFTHLLINFKYSESEFLANLKNLDSALNLDKFDDFLAKNSICHQLSDLKISSSSSSSKGQNKTTNPENLVTMVPWRSVSNFSKIPSLGSENTILASYKEWRKSQSLTNSCQDSEQIHNQHKLISLNCLAQTHLNNNLYLYKKNKPKYLDWSYRWQTLQNFFRQHPADILCLQEVEIAHLNLYEQFFKSDPIFSKSSDSGTTDDVNKSDDSDNSDNLNLNLSLSCRFTPKLDDKPDGCLLVYNTNKFELLKFYNLDLSVKTLFPQASPNIAQVGLLLDKISNSIFLVCNTHLVYSPTNGHVKLYQIGKILYELQKICYWINQFETEQRLMLSENESIDYSLIIWYLDENLNTEVDLSELDSSLKGHFIKISEKFSFFH